MLDSLKRIRLLATDILAEVVLHNRWYQVCLLGLVFLILGVQSLAQLPLGASSPKLIYDFGLGTILMSLGVVLVILIALQLYADLESGVLCTHLVRGLHRSEYLAGKLIGSWLAVAFVGCMATFVLSLLVGENAGGLTAEGIETLTPTMGVWIQLCLYLCFQWLVLGAVVVLLSVLSRSFLFAIVLSLLVWCVSMFVSAAEGMSESAKGISAIVSQILHYLLPRFDLSIFPGILWYDGPMVAGKFINFIGVEMLYAILLIVASILVFRRREL
ncbi:MAG: hypothetical protein P8L44_07920 [Opitutales bacterium]|nr:hypothetical protein [Opitutales bacterium]